MKGISEAGRKENEGTVSFKIHYCPANLFFGSLSCGRWEGVFAEQRCRRGRECYTIHC
jgi:hypothetical protein